MASCLPILVNLFHCPQSPAPLVSSVAYGVSPFLIPGPVFSPDMLCRSPSQGTSRLTPDPGISRTRPPGSLVSTANQLGCTPAWSRPRCPPQQPHSRAWRTTTHPTPPSPTFPPQPWWKPSGKRWPSLPRNRQTCSSSRSNAFTPWDFQTLRKQALGFSRHGGTGDRRRCGSLSHPQFLKRWTEGLLGNRKLLNNRMLGLFNWLYVNKSACGTICLIRCYVNCLSCGCIPSPMEA